MEGLDEKRAAGFADTIRVMRPLRGVHIRALLLFAATLPQASTRAVQHTTGTIELRECALSGVAAPVLCGTFTVPEDRGRHDRKIPLNIVVLKATGAAPKPDPIVPLQGGPGQAAVPLAPFYARFLAPLRDERDVVLIDVRGTGHSNPLNCDVTAPEYSSSADLLPSAAIEACRTRLQARADLRHYTTAAIAADLDAVRRAMRIERWNLYGTSYGTRLAQEYMRRFGPAVRTATLYGVVPPSFAIPLPYARAAQAAADAVFDADTEEAFSEVLSALRRRPVTVAHDGASVAVSEGLLAESIRHLLYNPASATAASNIIRAAADGNFRPAAEAVLRLRGTFSREIALGMFLSVTCTEDIPRIDEARVPELVRGTFLGDYRVRQQRDACRRWVAGTRPSGSAQPVISNVPALLFSGELDPVTPPQNGVEVLRTLNNGRHIVLAGNGHAMGASANCIVAILKQFIDTARTDGLDTGCTAATTQ